MLSRVQLTANKRSWGSLDKMFNRLAFRLGLSLPLFEMIWAHILMTRLTRQCSALKLFCQRSSALRIDYGPLGCPLPSRRQCQELASP